MKPLLVRLSIFCSVLHLADSQQVPAGLGGCWSDASWLCWRMTDHRPLSSSLSSSLFFFFFPPLATRAADRGGERRGETKERIVIWEQRADWVSKSLAPACCGRQPAKKRFLCTFTTVNGKFNQSYIEMVISCADMHVHEHTHTHGSGTYYITLHTSYIHAGAPRQCGLFTPRRLCTCRSTTCSYSQHVPTHKDTIQTEHTVMSKTASVSWGLKKKWSLFQSTKNRNEE